MRQIYIVQGSSGQHDEYVEWLVAAYTSETAAQAHCDRAQRAAAEIKQRRDAIWGEYEASLSLFTRLEEATVNPHDPVMRWDAPIGYTVVPLELHED